VNISSAVIEPAVPNMSFWLEYAVIA